MESERKEVLKEVDDALSDLTGEVKINKNGVVGIYYYYLSLFDSLIYWINFAVGVSDFGSVRGRVGDLSKSKWYYEVEVFYKYFKRVILIIW